MRKSIRFVKRSACDHASKDKKFRKSRDGGITSAGLISSGGGD